MAIPKSEIEELISYCDVYALFSQFGGQLEKSGSLLECCCLFHHERSPSMIVYPDKSYHCFGCGVNGDLISLVQEKEGLDFINAVRWLSKFSGYVPAGLGGVDGVEIVRSKEPVKAPIQIKEDKRKKWETITPVPANVPPIRLGTFNHYIRRLGRRLDPVAIWPYLDGGNNLLGVDARYEYSYQDDNGQTIQKKDVITWTWCRPLEDDSKGMGWVARPWANPCPLYGLNHLAEFPDAPVIIAEGCKAADAANAIDGYVGMTWRGGSNRAEKASNNNWKVLNGRDVFIWPDADEPGIKAAWYIAQHIIDIGAKSVRVVSVNDLPKGWDLADA